MNILTPLIRPYLSIFDSPLFALFTLLSFYQAWRGVGIIQKIWRIRASISREPLTRPLQQLADSAAFYVAVPVGVLLHELGHAITVWYYGGRVLEFGYFFFWGYVLPSQRFPLIPEWVIASAGTWGNLIFAALLWLFFVRWGRSSAWQYFGLRAIRFQIFFALIYYPIFTALMSIGDWRTIYNFQLTPWLAGTTAVIHLLIVLIHWQLERRGQYEMPAFNTAAVAQKFTQLAQQIQQNPNDLNLQDRYISTLSSRGAPKTAQAQLRTLLRQHPNWGMGYLITALMEDQKSDISPKAQKAAQRALQAGLPDAFKTGLAKLIIGQHALQTERYNEAQQQLNDALALFSQAPTGEDNPTKKHCQARLHYCRAQLARRQKNPTAALPEIEKALQLAHQLQQPAREAYYQKEKEIIQSQLTS